MPKNLPQRLREPGRLATERITYNLKGASEASGLSVRKLQYAISDGSLPSLTLGRRRLIPARALEEFLLRPKR
jgi:excisionase family DNA binding protein